MSSSEIMKVRLTADGIQEVISALKKVEGAAVRTKKSSEGIGSNLRNELRDLGIGVALQQLGRFVKANIEAQAAVQDLVEVSGASAEAISVLGMAAKKEGVSMEGLEKGVKGATKFMAALQEGSSEAKQTLSALGLSAQDLVGKSLDQQLVTIANAMDRFSDEGQSGMNKAALAMKIFGKNGGDMLQVMQRLSGDGFKRLQEEGIRTGQVLSGEAALAAKKAKEEISNLQGQVEGATNAFSQGLIPALGDAINGLSGVGDPKGLDGFRKVGEYVGKVAKGITSAFIIVGNMVAYVLNEIGTQAAALWEDLKTLAGVSSSLFSGDFKGAFKGAKGIGRESARALGSGRERFLAFLDNTGAALDDVWFRLDSSAGAASTKDGKGKEKGNLGVGGGSDSKAAAKAAAEGIAAAKRELEAKKQTLEEFNQLNEHYHEQELIDLDDYLENRRNALEYAGQIEVQALQDQIEAEKRLGKESSQTKINDLRAEIALKKQATTAALHEDSWKAAQDREAAKELAVTRAGSALEHSQGRLNLGLEGVDLQRAQGLISENEAIARKIALYQQYLPLLEEEARLQMEAAAATNDTADDLKAQQNLSDVETLKTKFGELGDKMKWLKDTAKDAATSGLSEFFMSLGNESDSLSDKIKNLARSIAQAVMQASAMKLAAAAMGGMGFSGGGWTGPGGRYEEAGVVHRDEFVFSQPAVRNIGVGALNLWHNAAKRGALSGLTMPQGSRPGYAEGGLVGAGAQPQTFKSEVSGAIAVHPPEGWVIEVLRSPEAVRIMAENVKSHSKRFNGALGRS